MVPAHAAQPGVLHRYSQRLVAFEHSTPSNDGARNVLLWIGGLGDGLHTVSYPMILSQSLLPGWCLAQVEIRSSLDGWGMGSLQRDVKDLAQCVTYFRKLKGNDGKVIIMGNSTGCQDVMEYVVGRGCEGRPKIDGGILQAPVSDREALENVLTEHELHKVTSAAQQLVKDGRENDALPSALAPTVFGPATISAYRWLSLRSPNKDGDDDYFSSDLPDERLKGTFGKFPARTPLLILPSGADEHVSPQIDQQRMVERWRHFVEKGGGTVSPASGCVSGAHHTLELSDENALKALFQSVNCFLEEIVGCRNVAAKLS